MFNDVRGLEKCLAMAQNAGYNINGRDSSGRTIMHKIARQGRWFDKGHPGVLELFLKNGLDLNAKDCLGLTPYDYAPLKEDREWLKQIGAKSSD
jgi:ankyrin repeat protein